MNKKVTVAVAGTLAAVLMTAAACAPQADREAPSFGDADATLSVSGNASDVVRISPDLFGLFLEDINYASQALDANMVADSSFLAPVGGGAWKHTDYWETSGATYTVKSDNNKLHENNTEYASVSAQAGGTLSNIGYDAVPIAVEEGGGYSFSAFIRNAGAPFDLTVSIKDGEKTYASVTFPVQENAAWVKYSYDLTSNGDAFKNVSLELRFGGAAEIGLDDVRLETKDATVGIKNYIFDVLKELSPKFLRFPGGCIIEGCDIATAYDWKNSVGATKSGNDDLVEEFTYTLVENGTSREVTTRGGKETRTPNGNLWQYAAGSRSRYYPMDYSIGFYEYFLLCEALGAEPVPILNAGLDCEIQLSTETEEFHGALLAGRHGNGVEDYIQDAKDLIYFANGSVQSSDADEKYWAQVRTDMGHPAPFNVRYLGIGNEQWSDRYYQCYQQFLEAFRGEENGLFHGVELIVGNGPNFEQCERVDATGMTTNPGEAKRRMTNYLNSGAIEKLSEYGIVDHHYYMSEVDFLLNTHFYDYYKRDYEVFVGEYSANNNAHYSGEFAHINNSWATALAEAAYMTGLEYNGDVVRLAAYAPMFGVCRTGNSRAPENQWAADMIFFTNRQLVLTPNYYVQQIFMRNTGTIVAKSSLTFAGDKPVTEHTTPAGVPKATKTTEDIHFVTSIDEATRDIIVKIVNAGAGTHKCNIEISDASLTGIADVWVLQQDDPDAVSSIEDGDAVYPEKYTVGSFTGGNVCGYEIPPYSVTALRFHTNNKY